MRGTASEGGAPSSTVAASPVTHVTPAGHGVEVWAPARLRAERLDLATLVAGLDRSPPVPLIALAAHPDDETVGLGRLIHLWSRTIGPVTAVVATAGEACVDHVAVRPGDLAARRLAEWQQALDVLGVTGRHCLGLPDGGLAAAEPDLITALQAVADELLTAGARPVLAAPWRGDPHPDHRAAGRAAQQVGGQLRLPMIEFGVWMTYWSDPETLVADQRRLAVLNVDPAADLAYASACAAFVTQLQPLAPDLGPVVPPQMLAHHRDQLVILPADDTATRADAYDRMTMDPSPPTRTNPVSQLTPTAGPWSLPPGYSRHHPCRDDLRQAMDHLASQAEWAELNWAGLVEALLRLGSTDIPLARLVEGHIDALRTLAQADCGPRPGARYGVWASRSAGTGIAAVAEADHLRLDGIIRFASGAGILDRALVPVWLDQDTHLLVDLDVAELPVDRSHWQTSAMRVSQSHTVMVHGVSVSRADVVGEPSFYLHRPAFLPGGVGVAAVWTGGLIRTLDVVVAMLSGRAVSPAQDARLGRARLQLITALTCVRAAGGRLEEILPMERNPTSENAGAASEDSELVAAISAESRAVVAGAVMTALAEVRVLAGPAGLAFDPDLGHALDDLGLYVAQLNLDAEVTRLGGELRAGRR